MTLEEILPLLECPLTREPLAQNGGKLVSGSGVTSFPLIGDVPLLVREPAAVMVMPQDQLSNALSGPATAFQAAINGPVLNLSAGGSASKSPHVVEVEFAVFRNTDVVADAHELPFRTNSFSGCLCMNALEHYRHPAKVLSEVFRVLKPGAELFLHTAGLQPLHEPPHHYFNVTRYGLQEWLQGFEILECRVSENFNPVYSLSWIAAELERHVIDSRPLDLESLRSVTLKELADFWRSPAVRGAAKWSVFSNLSVAAQESCAAGWEARVRKPLA